MAQNSGSYNTITWYKSNKQGPEPDDHQQTYITPKIIK